MPDVDYKMDVTFRQVGNSITVSIPAEIVRAQNIVAGQAGKIESGEFSDKFGILIVPIREDSN